MDRFIGNGIFHASFGFFDLKSSMDRFIEYLNCSTAIFHLYLKSSMDRFIVFKSMNYIYKKLI